tara:strand:+ start:1047 stop:2165 length:1119 start_codon:yes stop_codon:yes gene_type:complete
MISLFGKILKTRLVFLMVKNNKDKYLITGGCGFIGSCLTRYLLSNNEEVINIDKLTYSANLKAVGEVRNKKNYKLYKEDICNHNQLSKIIKKHRPTKIIHLAAETHVDRSIDGPSDFINSNIIGTFNILNISDNYYRSLSNKEKNKIRILLVSTDEVYGSLGKKDRPVNEERAYEPNSPYSASKAASDHLGRAWYKTYNLPILITNTTNNYGPWQFPEKLIPLTISKCLNNEKIPVYGKGNQVRDWIYVNDHVSGIMKVLNKGKNGEKYNIGGNNELKNIDVVKSICKIMDEIKPRKHNKKYEKLITFVQDRPGHDFRYALNNNKIKKIGWSPKTDWISGLEKTIKWYLDNINYLKVDSKKSYSGERLGKTK